MRDAVIDREFEHFRIDHDEPAFLRPEPVKQGQDHRGDRDRFARARGSRHEKMRHAGEIDDDRLAADRLSKRNGEPVLRLLEILDPSNSRKKTVSRRWFGSSMPMALRP